MMWDRIVGENGFIQSLEGLSGALGERSPAPLKVQSARVLNLRPRRD